MSTFIHNILFKKLKSKRLKVKFNFGEDSTPPQIIDPRAAPFAAKKMKHLTLVRLSCFNNIKTFGLNFQDPGLISRAASLV